MHTVGAVFFNVVVIAVGAYSLYYLLKDAGFRYVPDAAQEPKISHFPAPLKRGRARKVADQLRVQMNYARIAAVNACNETDRGAFVNLANALERIAERVEK